MRLAVCSALCVLNEELDLHSTANACYKDVADIAGQLNQFDKAIEKFELVRIKLATSGYV